MVSQCHVSCACKHGSKTQQNNILLQGYSTHELQADPPELSQHLVYSYFKKTYIYKNRIGETPAHFGCQPYSLAGANSLHELANDLAIYK